MYGGIVGQDRGSGERRTGSGGFGTHPLDRIAPAIAASQFVRRTAAPEPGYVRDTSDSWRNEFCRLQLGRGAIRSS